MALVEPVDGAASMAAVGIEPGAIDIDRQTRSQDAVATVRDAIKSCFPLEGRRKRWALVA